MKEYVFTELGLFRPMTCEKIKKAMDGRTFMNFKVKYANWAGNYILIICTDYEDTEENIKNFFLHCVLEVLAR